MSLPIGRTAAVLLAAGSGQRFGSDVPKQFIPLGGKPLFLHALHQLCESQFFEEICVVVPTDWIKWTEQQVKNFALVAEGGNTRQESSWKGLTALKSKPELVLIHDAARPFVSQKIIRNSLEAGWAHGAADVCIPSTDTLVFSQKGDFIESIPQRSHFLRGQTPQVFHYQKIVRAHLQTLERKVENASDDCRLILEMGEQVAIVQGDELNFKITSPMDLQLAEMLLLRSPLNQDQPSLRLTTAQSEQL